MFKGEGVVLESSVQICLCKMPRVPRLCEQAEISQFELTYLRPCLLQPVCLHITTYSSIQHRQSQQDDH